MRIFAIVIIAIAAAGCGKKPAAPSGPPQMPPAPVTLTEVIERPEAEWAECVGRLEPTQMVEVRPRVEGFIERIVDHEGADVKPGDLLLELDPKPFQVQVLRADAQCADAKARLELARKNSGRGDALLKSKAISNEEAEQRGSAVAIAEASAKAAEAALAAAQLDLSYTRVEATIAGRVGRTAISSGNLAGPSRAAVTTLISYDPIYVTFDLNERTWMSAQALFKDKEQTTIEVGLDGETGYPHAARLAFSDNRVDYATGTMRLRARLDNPDLLLLPGAYARIRLPVAAAVPRVLIDQRAICTDQNAKYVLVVDQGKAAYRPVTLGSTVGDLRIVKSGLRPGDPVILDIAKIFFPGMPVKLIEAAASSQNAAPAHAPAKSDAPAAEEKR